MAPSPAPVPNGYAKVVCPGFDTSGSEKDALVFYGWVIEGQLDIARLRSAWWKLLEAWPVLAGRLRVDPKAKQKPGWYYLVPSKDQLQKLKEEEDKKQEDDKVRLKVPSTVIIV